LEKRRKQVSQYLKVKTKAKGCSESLVRTLVDMGCAREDIEICEERRNLVGYLGKVREEKAHVIVKKDAVCKLLGLKYSASNELGFEKNADGTWNVYPSKHDKRIGIMSKDWKSKWLSKWAVQRIGLQAEEKGYSWTTEKKENHVYVRVQPSTTGSGGYAGSWAPSKWGT
jgi:ribosomal protein L11 methylase PrmA